MRPPMAIAHFAVSDWACAGRAPRLRARARCCRLWQSRREGFWSVPKGLRCCSTGRFRPLRNNDNFRTPGRTCRLKVRRDPSTPWTPSTARQHPAPDSGESRSSRAVPRPRIGPQRGWEPREEPRATHSAPKTRQRATAMRAGLGGASSRCRATWALRNAYESAEPPVRRLASIRPPTWLEILSRNRGCFT